MKKLMVFVFACVAIAAQGQSSLNWNLLKVGALVPDLVLHNIAYFPVKTAKVSDFRGKWLILDFWNKYCGSCIEEFPHTNAMQHQFGDKIQFMLVGIEDPEGEIREKFRALHDNMPLQLPCSFDSGLAKELDIYATPEALIIDPNGILRGIAGYMKEPMLNALLAGKDVKIGETGNEIPYDRNVPLMVKENGVGDSDVLYRSLLTRWLPDMANFSKDTLGLVNGKFEALRVNKDWLFKMAYLDDERTGRMKDSTHLKFWYYPVVVRGDSISYKGFSDEDLNTGEGWYCYSLIAPTGVATKAYLMRTMQHDLETYFGRYTVSVETRDIPCWKLVANEEARKNLPTKGGPPKTEKTVHGYYTQNGPISYILHAPVDDDYPVIDATGIKGNIDVRLDYGDGSVYVPAAKENAMRRVGLTWEKSTVPMRALVIKAVPE